MTDQDKALQYKMVVLDLDDTLLDKKHCISQQTVVTLQKMREMGVEVVIATGRMYCSALPYIKQLGLVETAITYNGAYIKDISTGQLLYHQPIEQEIAKEIIMEAEQAGLYINVYIDDQLYVSETNEKSELYKQISQIDSQAVGKLSDFLQAAPTKLLIIEEDRKKVKEYRSYFSEKYKGMVEVTESKAFFIEFMAAGVSKGRAIKKLADKLEIPLAEVIAVGDSWNDIEMLKVAGLGIAMGNAAAGVKKYADRIAGDHDNHGVSDILNEIFALK